MTCPVCSNRLEVVSEKYSETINCSTCSFINDMDKHIDTIEFEIGELSAGISCIEDEMQDAEDEKERILVLISEIKDSDEYEERVIILPGQISLMEVI